MNVQPEPGSRSTERPFPFGHGRALTCSRCRTASSLVWCTGWEERANEHLPAALGLPGPLPYLSFDRSPGHDPPHWKLDAIDDLGRRAAPAGLDRRRAQRRLPGLGRRAPGPTLLLETEPHVGLTGEHVDELIAWASALR